MTLNTWGPQLQHASCLCLCRGVPQAPPLLLLPLISFTSKVTLKLPSPSLNPTDSSFVLTEAPCTRSPAVPTGLCCELPDSHPCPTDGPHCLKTQPEPHTLSAQNEQVMDRQTARVFLADCGSQGPCSGPQPRHTPSISSAITVLLHQTCRVRSQTGLCDVTVMRTLGRKECPLFYGSFF